MKLWDKISSLIGAEKGAAQPAPASEEHAQAGGSVEQLTLGGKSLSPSDANTVLSMLPKGQGLDQFAAGQIQLLNIESVRTELGTRWAKVEHQVHLVVEATLRHILTDHDIFTRITDYEYLVIFPELSEQKASALMYVAAAQIRQKLFGQDTALSAIRLSATVTRVTRDLMGGSDNPVAAIHEAALAGQPAQAGTDKPDEPPLTPPIGAWTDKYKIVPIEGGGMTHGRIVADALQAGRPTPDFGAAADKSQTAGAASAHPSIVPSGTSDLPAPVAGYPVVPLSSGDRRENRLVGNAARPQTRLPDFSTMHKSSRAQKAGSTAGPRAIGQAQAAATSPIQGYAATPIAGGGMTEGRMVQDPPRPPGRLPDFAPAKGVSPLLPDSAPMAARLDALAAKSAPLRTAPIARQPVGSAHFESTAGTTAGAPVEIEELQLVYEPIWDVRRQAVTAYRMKVTLKVEGALLGLNEFSATYDDPQLQSALNSMILRKLVSQFQFMRGENKRAVVVAPIGRRFIDDQSGLRFLLDQLSLLNDQERQLVVLEIGDAYFGSWPTLAPRVALIHRMCRNVGVRLSLDHKDFQQVAAVGASSAVGDLSDHDWPERQTLGALNDFAAAASQASLRSSIGGLTTSSMVIAAVCAGLGHLSGSAIGVGTPMPLGVYPLSTEGFYLQRQAQRSQQDRD